MSYKLVLMREWLPGYVNDTAGALQRLTLHPYRTTSLIIGCRFVGLHGNHGLCDSLLPYSSPESTVREITDNLNIFKVSTFQVRKEGPRTYFVEWFMECEE